MSALTATFPAAELATAAAKGDFEACEQLEKQLVSERKAMLADLEEKKEKVRQHGHVFLAMAQRRQSQAHPVDAEVQVFTEAPRLHLRTKIAIGSGNDAPLL